MRDAVENLYQAFAPVRLNPDVSYCAHCVDAEQVAELHAYPLREVPVRAAAKLLSKGLSTWGDEAYFRHFTPRLLELVAAGELNDMAISVYLPGKLTISRPTGTPGEHAAVDRFLRAWWSATLAHFPSPVDVLTVYEIITSAGQPEALSLAAWPTADPRQLAVFSAEHAIQSPPRPAIDDWLRSGVPAALLTAAGSTTDDQELRDDLGWALECLDRLY